MAEGSFSLGMKGRGDAERKRKLLLRKATLRLGKDEVVQFVALSHLRITSLPVNDLIRILVTADNTLLTLLKTNAIEVLLGSE